MQSSTYPPRPAYGPLWAALLVCLIVVLARSAACQAISALTVPLRTPAAVAFDNPGNLYIAETAKHVIRRVDTAGNLTTVAGNGTQGFAGDGGLAVAAELDSPGAVVVDAAGNLYIADTHNHRIRRVDVGTGIISTYAGNGRTGFGGDRAAATAATLDAPVALAIDVGGNLFIADSNNHRVREVLAATRTIVTVAGNGRQGFSGDGGPGTGASIDTPSGLAVDGSGNLYLADTHNHRVRVVSAATGRISTLAGTGAAGFGGDNGTAVAARLALPHGLSLDPAGNLYVADTNNQRVRRVAVDGTIATVVGGGTQAFAGDAGPAVAAGLDMPQGTGVSPAGVLTFADTGNDRVRQVSAGNIVTVAGLGPPLQGALAITGPSVLAYGTGALTAVLATSTQATGTVSFLESGAGGTTLLGTAPLANNAAVLSTATLPVGAHTIAASYPGDTSHAATESASSLVSVTPALLTATVPAVSILYGQPVPALTGVLSGVLPQDAGNVSLTLASAAGALAPAGIYGITGTLSGSAAGNYVLAPLGGGTLTINRAPTAVFLAAGSGIAMLGQPVTLAMTVTSSTSGRPTGSVAVLDGTATLGTATLSPAGTASLTTSTLPVGPHALTASYPGDLNFVGSTTAAQTLSVEPGSTGDFTVAATGNTTQTVVGGTPASFTFGVQMQGATLSSPILLATTTLPVGMMASFTPNYLPPGGTVTAFILTIQTPKKAVAAVRWPEGFGQIVGLAVLLLPFGLRRRRVLGGAALALLLSVVGCGDRITNGSLNGPLTSYSITVSATATGPTGAALLHTATVNLSVQ